MSEIRYFHQFVSSVSMVTGIIFKCHYMTPIIFCCSVTPLAVYFTVFELLSVGKGIEYTLALYLPFLDLIYFFVER